MNPWIIYEDDYILVADKPGGMLSVPGRGPDKQDCLINRLLVDYPEALVVHRLDQGTSGLMIFARDKESQRRLGRCFEEKRIRKEYEALLLGKLPSVKGRAEYFQRLDPDNRPWQIIDEEKGKRGITEWEVRDVSLRGRGSPEPGAFFSSDGKNSPVTPACPGTGCANRGGSPLRQRSRARLSEAHAACGQPGIPPSP